MGSATVAWRKTCARVVFFVPTRREIEDLHSSAPSSANTKDENEAYRIPKSPSPILRRRPTDRFFRTHFMFARRDEENLNFFLQLVRCHAILGWFEMSRRGNIAVAIQVQDQVDISWSTAPVCSVTKFSSGAGASRVSPVRQTECATQLFFSSTCSSAGLRFGICVWFRRFWINSVA